MDEQTWPTLLHSGKMYQVMTDVEIEVGFLDMVLGPWNKTPKTALPLKMQWRISLMHIAMPYKHILPLLLREPSKPNCCKKPSNISSRTCKNGRWTWHINKRSSTSTTRVHPTDLSTNPVSSLMPAHPLTGVLGEGHGSSGHLTKPTQPSALHW